MRGNVDGFLARGGVEHEENFLRLHKVAQANEFLHEHLVDLQAAGGVEENHVAAGELGELLGVAGDFEHVRFAALHEGGHSSCLPSVSSWSMAAGR